MVLSTKFYKIAKSVLKKKKTQLSYEEREMIKKNIMNRSIIINTILVLIFSFITSYYIVFLVVGIILRIFVRI